MFPSCSIPSFEGSNEVRDEEIHSEVQPQPNAEAEPNVPLRRSTRSHKIPGYLQDYVCCSLSEEKKAFCFSTVMMYMVLMITNPSVVVVPNRFLLLFSMP